MVIIFRPLENQNSLVGLGFPVAKVLKPLLSEGRQRVSKYQTPKIVPTKRREDQGPGLPEAWSPISSFGNLKINRKESSPFEVPLWRHVLPSLHRTSDGENSASYGRFNGLN